jgi:hypothetical protein
VDECRDARGEVTREIRLAVADAMAWAVRLQAEVLGERERLPQDVLHGARWARNRIVHGHAHLLALALTRDADRSFDSRDI